MDKLDKQRLVEWAHECYVLIESGADVEEIELRLIKAYRQGVSAQNTFLCKAQTKTDPPQDCDWPGCGCDPYADKVLAALEEAREVHEHTWTCGCGWRNGVNLATCAQCGRQPGGDNPCTQDEDCIHQHKGYDPEDARTRFAEFLSPTGSREQALAFLKLWANTYLLNGNYWDTPQTMGAALNQALALLEPTPSHPWRLGRKVPLNVYEEERPICQCHYTADAALIVTAVNSLIITANNTRMHNTGEHDDPHQKE